MPKGSCLCGAIRYETPFALEAIDHCHCSMCRRSHGSAFATYGRVPSESLTFTTGRDQLREYQSSDVATRSFCGRCGSSLLYRHSEAPQFDFITVGTLDDDPGSRPRAHIFVGSKAAWYPIDDDLPQHEQYSPSTSD